MYLNKCMKSKVIIIILSCIIILAIVGIFFSYNQGKKIGTNDGVKLGQLDVIYSQSQNGMLLYTDGEEIYSAKISELCVSLNNTLV